MARKNVRHKHNGGYPETRADAGEQEPLLIAGSQYRLRNGAIVKIYESRVTALYPWTGRMVGAVGQHGLFWRADGAHGATWVGHELDIMGKK